MKGLDDLIEGGLPPGYCYLLLGGPGSGKTTFGMQYLFKGCTEYSQPGMYVTFDEPPSSISTNMLRYGWDMGVLEGSGQFAFVDVSPIKKAEQAITTFVPPALRANVIGAEKFSLDDLVKTISEVKKKINAKRCVIDSLSALTLQYKDHFTIRQQVLQLIKHLTELDLTTIMLAENPEDRPELTQFGPEAFLAQGVIVLHMYRVEESNVRAMEIRKMRGVKHTDRLSPFRLTQEGVEVYPEETVFRSM